MLLRKFNNNSKNSLCHVLCIVLTKRGWIFAWFFFLWTRKNSRLISSHLHQINLVNIWYMKNQILLHKNQEWLVCFRAQRKKANFDGRIPVFHLTYWKISWLNKSSERFLKISHKKKIKSLIGSGTNFSSRFPWNKTFSYHFVFEFFYFPVLLAQ